MLIIGIGSMWATVDTQIIKPSTSTSDPEHVYFMHSMENDNYFATKDTYASNTAADAAKFAFFQAKDANGNAIENAYYIYCIDNSKWMSYSKAASYGDKANVVTMVTTKASANYFKLEYVTMTASSVKDKKAYAIHPYNTSGGAVWRCLNWYNGPTSNTSSTIGTYKGDGSQYAGNGWAFIEVPRIGRYYRIKSYACNKYLTTNSATDATDNTTLYCYTDKGLAQISSGNYYDGSAKSVGTTQYTATFQPNVNSAPGTLQFQTNGYWAYCNTDGSLDGRSDTPGANGYAWYFEEVADQFPFKFAATLNDIQDAKWYNLTVREQYLYYNSDGTFHDGVKDASPIVPGATDKTAWFAFVGDPFRGFKIFNFASAATLGSDNVSTDTRIKAVRPSDAATYVFEIVSYSGNLAWQIRDTRDDNAFLNQQGTNLGIWNWNARGDLGNVFTITEVEDAAAEHFVTYNIVTTDINGENEISWSYDRIYEASQTVGETPETLPFIGDYYCADPTLSDPVCSLTYTATHTMPFVNGKYYFMRQRKNNESAPKNGYAYYDSERNTNGMPKTKSIGDSENYLWEFVGNPYDGYCIYNKAKGESQGLFMNSSANSLTWSSTPSRFILQKMSTADANSVLPAGASSTYFKLKGSANNSLHDLNGDLNNWNNSGSVTDAGSIIGFYEAEEYTVTVVTPDGFPGGGGITANGNDYDNGAHFCVVKGTVIEAKAVAGYAFNVTTTGNTINVTYQEAQLSLNVIYRYKENDSDSWTQLKNPGSVNVSNGTASSVLVSLTADETKKFTGGTFQIGDGEASNFTMNSFAEAYNEYINVTASEDATLYINLRVRPLPTTGKLYRFYNVGNTNPYMYQNGSKLDVKQASTSGDLSEMFYLLETETPNVYNIINAKNGKGFPEINWANGSCTATFNHNGTFQFERQSNLSVAIGQTTQTGNKKYLHANWNNGNGSNHVVVWNSNTDNSRWYIVEVSTDEIVNHSLVITQGELNCMLWSYPFGEGVGKYHYTEDSETRYSGIEAAIYRQTSIADIINLGNSVVINQPTPGYYRIKNKATSRYVNCTKVDDAKANTSGDTEGENNSKTIFYIDSEKDIQAYDNGAYWKGVYRMGRGTFDGGTYGTLTYKHPWQFVEGNSLGTYKLIYGNDTEGKYHATGVGEATGYAELNTEDANADKATWTLVEVTELPARTESGSAERGNEITIAPAGTEVNENVPNVLVETSTPGTYTCNNLQLNDDVIAQFTSETSFTDTKVTYSRAATTSQWGTIYLPYAPATEEGVSYYELTASGGNSLTFTKVENPAANTPYMYKKTSEGEMTAANASAAFALGGDTDPHEGSSVNSYQLVGILTNSSVVANDGIEPKTGYNKIIDPNAYYFKNTDNTFRPLPTSNIFSMKAFRCYLTNSNSARQSVLGFSYEEDGQPTGVSIIESEDGKTVDVIFDLNGRRLQNAKKGINIINGKKVIK